MAPVRTLDRGLRILDRVIADDKPLKLRDVAEAFDIDRAMAFRFLQTLCEFGLLHKDGRTKDYSLGGHFYSWMIRARERLDVAETVRPHLREVVRRTEQSAHLGMLVDDQVLLIDFVPSDSLISVNNRIGVLEPVYCTAIGKAIASQLPVEERDALIDRLDLVRHSPRTITDPKALRTQLAKVARDGFAVDDGEFNELLACVAVPLRLPEARSALSIGVSMIRPVIADDDKIVGTVTRHLREVAAEIESHPGRRTRNGG